MLAPLKRLLPESAKAPLRRAKEKILLDSLREAIAEQGLRPWVERLTGIIPDISRQYSGFTLDTDYLLAKVRGQHAFQMELACWALEGGRGAVVDIGDSSGTHLAYLKALKPDPARRYLSVNIDEQAVAKVRAKGFEAIKARAEDLAGLGVQADVFLLLETLEHLNDPISFLKSLADRGGCRRLVLTVPYVRQSRVALHYVREGDGKTTVNPEKVHVFELSPEDLGAIFRHTGWRVEREQVYYQYPRRSLRRALQPLWRSEDFEGFYGAVLTPDPRWTRLYQGW